MGTQARSIHSTQPGLTIVGEGSPSSEKREHRVAHLTPIGPEAALATAQARRRSVAAVGHRSWPIWRIDRLTNAVTGLAGLATFAALALRERVRGTDDAWACEER